MKKSCPGFTLVELLVVISITTVIFTIGMAQYNRFNRRQILKQTAITLKRGLELARNKAMAGEKDCSGTLDGYEVTFSSGSYTFRAKCGANYGSETTVSLPHSISIDSSPGSVLFKVLSQGAIIQGSNLVVLSGYGQTETIQLTEMGGVIIL